MRISEITESEESLITYLALLGHDITYYEKGSTIVKEQYKLNPTPQNKVAVTTILNSANCDILAIVHDKELWERFESDPEVGSLYNRLVILYNDNSEFLETIW